MGNLLHFPRREPDHVQLPQLSTYNPAAEECGTEGCGRPGGTMFREHARKTVCCPECERAIVRCFTCWLRFRHVRHCTDCTGGRGCPTAPTPRHLSEWDEWDLDANGWASNARKLLEELE